MPMLMPVMPAPPSPPKAEVTLLVPLMPAMPTPPLSPLPEVPLSLPVTPAIPTPFSSPVAVTPLFVPLTPASADAVIVPVPPRRNRCRSRLRYPTATVGRDSGVRWQRSAAAASRDRVPGLFVVVQVAAPPSSTVVPLRLPHTSAPDEATPSPPRRRPATAVVISAVRRPDSERRPRAAAMDTCGVVIARPFSTSLRTARPPSRGLGQQTGRVGASQRSMREQPRKRAAIRTLRPKVRRAPRSRPPIARPTSFTYVEHRSRGGRRWPRCGSTTWSSRSRRGH